MHSYDHKCKWHTPTSREQQQTLIISFHEGWPEGVLSAAFVALFLEVFADLLALTALVSCLRVGFLAVLGALAGASTFSVSDGGGETLALGDIV